MWGSSVAVERAPGKGAYLDDSVSRCWNQATSGRWLVLPGSRSTICRSW
jgi:hypothetical protein